MDQISDGVVRNVHPLTFRCRCLSGRPSDACSSTGDRHSDRRSQGSMLISLLTDFFSLIPGVLPPPALLRRPPSPLRRWCPPPPHTSRCLRHPSLDSRPPCQDPPAVRAGLRRLLLPSLSRPRTVQGLLIRALQPHSRTPLLVGCNLHAGLACLGDDALHSFGTRPAGEGMDAGRALRARIRDSGLRDARLRKPDNNLDGGGSSWAHGCAVRERAAIERGGGS